MAHEGVQNPAVMARMHGMKDIASQMKVLGDMAKGTRGFDQAQARASLTAIGQHAAEMPDLFRAPEDDPKSEARPEIWASFDDFVAKSLALQDVANISAESVASQQDVRDAVAAIGPSCKACHRAYRK